MINYLRNNFNVYINAGAICKAGALAVINYYNNERFAKQCNTGISFFI